MDGGRGLKEFGLRKEIQRMNYKNKILLYVRHDLFQVNSPNKTLQVRTPGVIIMQMKYILTCTSLC